MQLPGVLRAGAKVAVSNVVKVCTHHHPFVGQRALATQDSAHILCWCAAVRQLGFNRNLGIIIQGHRLDFASVGALAPVQQCTLIGRARFQDLLGNIGGNLHHGNIKWTAPAAR